MLVNILNKKKIYIVTFAKTNKQTKNNPQLISSEHCETIFHICVAAGDEEMEEYTEKETKKKQAQLDCPIKCLKVGCTVKCVNFTCMEILKINLQ